MNRKFSVFPTSVKKNIIFKLKRNKIKISMSRILLCTKRISAGDIIIQRKLSLISLHVLFVKNIEIQTHFMHKTDLVHNVILFGLIRMFSDIIQISYLILQVACVYK